jgi:hypothetical protein
MRVGITGHQRLQDSIWVKHELVRILQIQAPPLIGVTSLALGADQLFSQAVLDCGGSLHVIVPMPSYAHDFAAEALAEYERLLSAASEVDILPAAASKEEAYFVAGKKVVEQSDLLIAVWNGKPAAGLGGTGDVIQYAMTHGKRYIHINPVTQQIIPSLSS